MVEVADSLRDVGDVSVLADPVRRELYLYVSSQPAPVGRDQAAHALGIPHHQAKFQLDRLEEAGLLVADYTRLSGRSGPGAGRPAKIYRRSEREISVSLPGREYALAGELMAEAITLAAGEGVPVLAALDRAAVARGRSIGGQARQQAVRLAADRIGDSASDNDSAVAAPIVMTAPIEIAPIDIALAALIRFGYEPRVECGIRAKGLAEASQIVLANCPFHSLAATYTELVCGLNQSLVSGICASVGGLSAHLDPAPGRCCVVVRTAPTVSCAD